MSDDFLATASISDLIESMRNGEWTARSLVQGYLERIERLDREGPRLHSVIETNPDALEIADERDSERRAGRERGPLHGIPILVKDNVDTADGMSTTAGSRALEGPAPVRDAFVAARLRDAGAVLLGKANLSEWANFRSSHSSSGWSARGGQCLNPYALDRTPSGSSSGSAAAVAAGLAAASLGTETDGSILSPGAACGVVGVKPTVGLTSRAGVIPISHSQDTVGCFARCVADAALVLQAIAGPDSGDAATLDAPGPAAADFRMRSDALRGARIGVARDVYFGYSPRANQVAEAAIAVMRDLGADVVDPADIPTAQEIDRSEAELEVLLHEFKAGLNSYLATRDARVPVHSLAELIEFNLAHAAEEMPHFGQEILEMAETRGPVTDEVYRDAIRTTRRMSRQEGIDAVLGQHRLDALVMPTGSPAVKIDLINGGLSYGGSSQPAAWAGYPAVTVPAGYVSSLPVGLTFMGTAWHDWKLLELAHAFEQATRVWSPPTYTPLT